MKKYLFALFLFCCAASAEKMNIVFTSDGNFGQHTCVTMASILKNSLPEDEFAFYIVDEGVKNEDKAKIENLKKLFKPFDLQYITVPNSMKNRLKIKTEFVHKRFGGLIIYYRLFLPIVLNEIDKALYLDGDLYIKSSLKEFYHTDITNHYCLATIACRINTWSNYKKEVLSYKQITPGHSYFNNGVMLLNLKKIRKDDLIDELIDRSNEFIRLKDIRKRKFLIYEQDVMNNVFGNKALVLDMLKYNFYSHPGLMSIRNLHNLINVETAQNATIYHFNSAEKPWNTWLRHPHIKEVLKDYFALTDLVGYEPRGFVNKVKETVRRWWVTF